jgi:hypothetical protein
MLDNLDKELETRGHAFCRYADDCNIYVRREDGGRESPSYSIQERPDGSIFSARGRA